MAVLRHGEGLEQLGLLGSQRRAEHSSVAKGGLWMTPQQLNS